MWKHMNILNSYQELPHQNKKDISFKEKIMKVELKNKLKKHARMFKILKKIIHHIKQRQYLKK